MGSLSIVVVKKIRKGNTLIFDITSIALKFVDSEHMRKLLGMRKAQHIENPYSRGNREINGFSNRSERTFTS